MSEIKEKVNEQKTIKQNTIEEIEITKNNGGMMLFLLLLGLVAEIGIFALAIYMEETDKPLFAIPLVASIILFICNIIALGGFRIIHPNEAGVYTLFGKYYGTIKKSGFYWITPFATIYNPSAPEVSIGDDLSIKVAQSGTGVSKSQQSLNTTVSKKISTKITTLNNDKQKVNDALGNPVIIGAAVIWKVVNPTKAVLNVDNYITYLSTQCDAIIRNNARLYPYDTMDDDENSDKDEKTLRGSSQEIAENMKVELQKRVEEAGIEIKEVRITNLAYSDEIAAAMLQRQQAVAVIAARQKIVEGAVSMVKMAIDQLGDEDIVVLDEERKAAMVSNLLVVLCGNKDAQPIVNSGSIY